MADPRPIQTSPLDHPERAALFTANTSLSGSIGFLLFVAILTLIGMISAKTWGGRETIELVGLGLSGFAAAVAQLTFNTVVQRRFDRLFYSIGCTATIVKLFWAQLLAWTLPSPWDFASAAVLCSLIVGWAMAEAIYVFDTKIVRLAWGIGLLTLPFYWTIDNLLRPANNFADSFDNSRLLSFIITIAILQGVVQGIFGILGRDARLQQEARDRLREIESENQTLKSERETISRVAKVLSGTVAGQRLRHDAASPLQVLGFGLDALGDEGPTEERDEILGDMRQALTSLESLVTSLRTDTEEDVGSLTAVEALIERTLSSARGTLLGHQVKAAPVTVEVETAEVWSGPEHPVAIASLICNASLLAPELPVTVRGRVVNPYFYRLEIRDQAAIGEAQRTGYERVRLGLRLRRMGTDSRGGRWRGMGIGLPLCRLQLSRHGSWVDVSLPETGPGLMLQVIMPRVEPATIPESENTPERWVIA